MKSFKVKTKKRKLDGDEEVIDELYNMGGSVVKKSNPFIMLGRSLGFSKDKQKEINKGKVKVSSPHLKMMGQGDVKNYKEKK